MKRTITPILLVLGIYLFDFLFWQEKPGINLPIFTTLLLLYSLWGEHSKLFKKETLFAVTASTISGAMIVWNNTGLSVFIHVLSVIIALGIIKQEKLSSSLEGIAGFLVTYLSIPFDWLSNLQKQKEENKALAFAYSFIKLGLLPLGIFIIFFIIYREASPKFEGLTHSIITWLSEVFEGFSFAKTVFILFGFSLLALGLHRKGYKLEALISKSDQLIRKQAKPTDSFFQIKRNLYAELVNEYKMAIIVFALLNLLLLVVNILDITWIWFDFVVPMEFNLKQFVHEGTFLLIFSILLSMAIVLYFFRSSLNFYPKKRTLVILGKVWIIQNMILAISVFIRNYHYIDYHGLAGKRIGVIAFLVMTLFGLSTLILKVDRLKTFAYLIRKNGWFIIITLSLVSCLHWDKIIVNYNLTHWNPGEIDVDYYLDLSPTVAPILLKNIDIVEQQMQAHINRDGKEIWLDYLDIDLFKEQLEYNTSQYLLKQKEYGFGSWNLADNALLKKTTLIEKKDNGRLSVK